MKFPRRTLLAAALGAPLLSLLPAPARAGYWPLPDVASSSNSDWWWQAFRQLTLAALESVPEVGGVIALFGSLFLPASIFGDDGAQWKAYIQAVNRIVDEKIEDALYLQLSAALSGFTQAVRLYQSAQQSGDMQHLRSTVDALNVAFAVAMPQFMLQGHEQRLLPLFVPVANLHLGLLRQAVQLGRARGFPPAVIADYQAQLQAGIRDYGRYYDDVVAAALVQQAVQHPHDDGLHRDQPLAAVYALRSLLQSTVGDIRDCWPFFDTARFPAPLKLRLDRELFSPLLGSYYDNTQPEPSSIVLPAPPAGPIERIDLQGFLFVDGMSFFYAPGQGPARQSQLHVGGNGGRHYPYDDVVARQHVRSVVVQHGYALDALQMQFGDGSSTGLVGNGGPGDPRGRSVLAYPDHHLSSVIGFGTAPGYGGVLSGCMFGFQLDTQTAPVAMDPLLRQHLQRVWPSALLARSPDAMAPVARAGG